MNLFYYFKVAFGLIGIFNVNAFIKVKNCKHVRSSLVKYMSTDPISPFKKKINGLVKLIRPKSILPTLLLNLSGGCYVD